MTAQSQVCPECDAVIKGGICLSCGFVLDENAFVKLEKPKSKKGEKDEDETEEPVESEAEAVPEAEKPQVRSIFADVEQYDEDDSPVKEVENVKAKNKIIVPVLLAFVLLLLGGLSYWRFVYFKPEFISPVVLSMTDIGDPAIFYQDNTRTLEFEADLVEGNFESNNYAQFASLDVKAFIHAFDLKHAFSKFDNDSLLQDILTSYDIDDDDLEVYFAKGFALLYPEDSLSPWGFVIEVRNKEYVESRISRFRANKENPNYEFVDYYADIVEILPDVPVEEETTETNETEELVDDEADSAETESEDEQLDETEEVEEEIEELEPKYYLLVSNSNEYLDQMKESSEGNLANLASELKYTNSRLNLPILGDVYVYRDTSSPIWGTFAEIVQNMYSYEGLDKIIESVQSVGAAVSSADSKTRITVSSN